MLSPPIVIIRSGYASRLGNFTVQPLPSAVAVRTQVANTLSVGPTIDLPSQVPATSDNLIPPLCACTGLQAAPMMQASRQERVRFMENLLSEPTGDAPRRSPLVYRR